MTFYSYIVSHGMQARISVSLNDVPFYRSVPEPFPKTRSAAANHLLVAGENVLTLTIWESTPSGGALVRVTRDGDDRAPLLEIAWPEVWRERPVELCRLPSVHAARFHAPALGGEPAWVGAEEADFGPDGDDAMWGAVESFHRAFQAGDADTIAERGWLKMQEMRRSYPTESGFTREAATAQMKSFYGAPHAARPLRREDVVFERCAGGRVAYVHRRDGGTVIDVESPGRRRALKADVWLTRPPPSRQWHVLR